jgi:dihydrofolate reductase
MSVDGFIAGPNDGVEKPLGSRNGKKIFEWYFSGSVPNHNSMFTPKGANVAVVDEMFERMGAMLTGRRTYDIAKGWNGTHPVNAIPVVVLTHRVPDNAPKGKSKIIFVEDDIRDAVKKAKEAAGDKDVGVGGASAAQQCIKAGLADELFLHVAPILLGAGVRLFEHLGNDSIKLELIRTIESPEATHLRYRIAR